MAAPRINLSELLDEELVRNAATRRVRLCAVVAAEAWNASEEEVASVIAELRSHVDAVYRIVAESALPAAQPVDPRLRLISLDEPHRRGAALAAGFSAALNDGFTHALTIAVDGRHRPSEIPLLVRACQDDPEALIVGARRFTTSALSTLRWRVMRAVSNTVLWVLMGRWVADSLCGFRIYPLAAVDRIELRAEGPDFETEVLAKCVWTGMRYTPVEVHRDPSARGDSMLASLRAFLKSFRVLPTLTFQRLLFPPNVRGLMHLKMFRRRSLRERVTAYVNGILFQENPTPMVFAWSCALGIFLGILPIFGLQMIVAYWISQRIGLSAPVAAAGTTISFGPMLPVIIYGSLLTGQVVMGHGLDWSLDLEDFEQEGVWPYLVEYLVGSAVFAVVGGALSGVLGYFAARAWLGNDAASQAHPLP